MQRVRYSEIGQAAVDGAAAILLQGGVVAYATDTLYGLAVDPRRDDAVEKLFAIKGRDASAAIPLIAATVEQARLAGTFGGAELRLAARFWPGPLSIVVPANETLSRLVCGGGTTVALRVPAHAVARALAGAFGVPITATSANLSGRAPTASPDEVADSIGNRIDMLLDAGPAPGGAPSTIVEVRNGVPCLVRPGAIAWDRVLRSVK